MKITLLTVGRTDVEWVRKGLELYISRLKHYVPFSLVEIPELKNVSALTRDQIRQKEGELVRAADDLARKTAETAATRQEVMQRDEEIAELKKQLAARDVVHERAWTTEVVEPEVVVDEMPPPVARQAFGFGTSGAASSGRPVMASSLADLERRAQEELARMGAGVAKKFFKFRA